MKIYTGGTFDVFHAGHMNFLRGIKKLFPNSELYVSLNTDEFIIEYKKKAPIFNYEERKNHLKLSGLVDYVVPNIGGKDSKPAILIVSPDVIVIGTDWLERDYPKQMDFTSEWLQEHSISLVYIPYTKDVSTSIIKERIKNAE